jgi:hypothetical protein
MLSKASKNKFQLVKALKSIPAALKIKAIIESQK